MVHQNLIKNRRCNARRLIKLILAEYLSLFLSGLSGSRAEAELRRRQPRRPILSTLASRVGLCEEWRRAECPRHRWSGHSARDLRRHRMAKVDSIGRDGRSPTQPRRLSSLLGRRWVVRWLFQHCVEDVRVPRLADDPRWLAEFQEHDFRALGLFLRQGGETQLVV